ncbi:unannotated protein [freshwater metagenome]|uniref:Unannotated protein n=1 Tax=freshwater metagenome TaxID=449393 RepID=A0A6J7UKE8_9ZZZZ
MRTALGTEESDIGSVVLAATVGATGNVDANSAHFGETLCFKFITNCLG